MTLDLMRSSLPAGSPGTALPTAAPVERPKSYPNLKALIEQHKRYFDMHERTAFEKARRLYRGEAWTAPDNKLDDNARKFFCSKNIIYAIADTGISQLLGPNPQVAATATNPQSEQLVGGVNALMAYIFRANSMRAVAGLTLVDATLCKRGIFKTGWSSSLDAPSIDAVDPAMLFFDTRARLPAKIRYWLEATLVPWTEFKARVEKGRYHLAGGIESLGRMKPGDVPQWMKDSQDTQTEVGAGVFQWVLVWEYYDRIEGRVAHYLDETDEVVFQDTFEYIPYSMYSLNHSGVDCRGLSEVQLILNQQETINDLLTHWKRIVYMMIPKILYDAGRISSDQLDEAMMAATGSFVPIVAQESETLRTFANLFFPMPLPELPPAVTQFVEREEQDAAFISALAEAARGQVVGAKTATEMAIIDASLRTRLATREGHLGDAIADVAKKCLWLCQRYMKTPKQVRLGGNAWATMNLAELREVDMDFALTSYNPLKQNPAVMAETMLGVLDFLVQNENVDIRVLTEQLVEGLGLPRSTIKPMEVVQKEKAETAAAMQEAAGAQQEMALGGAAAGAPALDAQAAAGEAAGAAGMPLEDVMTALGGGGGPAAPEESFAAGGGSPVR